ncbi:SAV_6107 family HEPN domain-containing protein [Amycolatopsis suaedae]|uniref:SAV_6107 family HEPN domain-containing protein n=1 Tax=Amycolatopsis suaedae TaxID=2510978 RepID=UPI0013EF0F07|nr:SAV_6107 family HEPN domain-containing protein [Amycolatopsis suaedae]
MSAVAAVNDTTQTAQTALPLPLRGAGRTRPPSSAVSLLTQARREHGEATRQTDPVERYTGSYYSALRAAAAVLAARGRPHRGRARPASVWVLLDSTVPELGEWAAYFDSHSATHAAAQAGLARKVTADLAAELHEQSGRFLEVARGLVHTGRENGRGTVHPATRRSPLRGVRSR